MEQKIFRFALKALIGAAVLLYILASCNGGA